MTSTVTNHSNLINSAYPIAGQANNTQGFRDNFSYIQNSLNVASDEITRLQNAILGTGSLNEIVLVANTSSDLTTATFTVNNGSLFIDGVNNITFIGNLTTTSTFVGPIISNSNAYASTFTFTTIDNISIGSSFKFFSTETTVHSVTDINTLTNEITVDPFDPLELIGNINSGTVITFTNGSRTDKTVTFINSQPQDYFGRPGDKKGYTFLTEGWTYVAISDYVNSSTQIWTYTPTSTFLIKETSTGTFAGDTISQGNVTYDVSRGSQIEHKVIDGQINPYFTNFPETHGRFTYQIVVWQSGTPYSMNTTTVYIGNNSIPVKWDTSTGTDVSCIPPNSISVYSYTFSNLSDQTPLVLGSRKDYV